jgi:hypothetical protein
LNGKGSFPKIISGCRAKPLKSLTNSAEKKLEIYAGHQGSRNIFTRKKQSSKLTLTA